MKTLKTPLFLYIVILLEGYIVLSSEILAIRILTPFVGSGTDTISIVIASVLMPLAIGYYTGGRFANKPISKRGFLWVRISSLRDKLIYNITVSSIFLLFGLSFILLSLLFGLMFKVGLDNRILQTITYTCLFIVVPVYLLGQTIPLVSNYFSHEQLSKVTGKMLFFSTLGSFLGSVFSTLFLMSTIGVHNTVVLNFVFLAVLVLLLNKKLYSTANIITVSVLVLALYFNSSQIMQSIGIVENNEYNTIIVTDSPDGGKNLSLNFNNSSYYRKDGKKHRYIMFVEDNFINNNIPQKKPMQILVLGAGGFTFGMEDKVNRYDFVDIDPNLKSVSEKYFLEQELQDNKKFYPIAARSYLSGANNKYDLILVDMYQGNHSIPEHLVTREFFLQVKKALNEGGVLVANIHADPAFRDAYSRNIDTTIRSVFPYVTSRVIENYNDMFYGEQNISNIMYVYRHYKELDNMKNTIYTDNLNKVFIDKLDRQR